MVLKFQIWNVWLKTIKLSTLVRLLENVWINFRYLFFRCLHHANKIIASIMGEIQTNRMKILLDQNQNPHCLCLSKLHYYHIIKGK